MKERFLCFIGIQKGFSGIKRKIFTGTLKNLKNKNSLYSLIEASLEPKYNRSFGRMPSRISVYLYEKNKPYPENYIGRTPMSLVKRFGISEKEAVQLFIKEVNTLLKTVQSDHVRDTLKKKIANLDRKYPAK